MTSVAFALDLHDPRNGERLEILGTLTLRTGAHCPWFIACQNKKTGEGSLVAVNALRGLRRMSRHLEPYYDLERRP